MALKEPKRGASRETPERHSAMNDIIALADYVRENPLIAAAVAGFVVLVVAVGLLFLLSQKAATMEANTELAMALDTDDPAMRAESLETVAATRERVGEMALYLAAEAAVRAQKYEEARGNFQQLLTEYPDSEYAARAAEGLAFLQENDGDLEGALQAYRDVIDTYPGSFTAQTMYLRIGKLLIKLERPLEAIDAYTEQFRVFPQARVTANAMNEIRNLSDSTDTEVADAADAAFRMLSEESPMFKEQFPYYYVEPEAVEPEAALTSAEDGAPLANTGAITVTPIDESTEAPADVVEAPADVVEAPADAVEAPADAVEAPADAMETPAESAAQ